MKLYLLDPHDNRLYNNEIFNPSIDKSFIAWKKLKKELLQYGITLDTIDLHPLKNADNIYFIDHNFFTLNRNKPSPYLAQCIEKKIPKEKLNLIITENPIIKPDSWNKTNHNYYNRVFTWNDTLVDNKNYFHYRILQDTFHRLDKQIPFKKKKLITLINAHKTNYGRHELYSLRIKAIRFFEKNYPGMFDLYGVGWNQPLNIKFLYSLIGSNWYKAPLFIKDFISSHKKYTSYLGPIDKKIEVMNKYKYCICFENMTNIDGYITEKIFDSFKARCIPVYYGAPNITDYIPKETFIDYREFKGFEDLIQFLIKMTESDYRAKILAIEKFLKNEFKLWDYKHFAKDIFLK